MRVKGGGAARVRFVNYYTACFGRRRRKTKTSGWGHGGVVDGVAGRRGEFAGLGRRCGERGGDAGARAR